MNPILPVRPIVHTRGVLSGRPRIDGTRIGVITIVRSWRHGWTIARIQEEYPSLRPGEVETALWWFFRTRTRKQQQTMLRERGT